MEGRFEHSNQVVLFLIFLLENCVEYFLVLIGVKCLMRINFQPVVTGRNLHLVANWLSHRC